MKKFLTGLPITLIGLFLFLLPGLIFGEIGMYILIIILFIGTMGFFSYVAGEEILEKLKSRK